MTREQTQNAIVVMQAWLKGWQIQSRLNGSWTWKHEPNPEWNWFAKEYRITPPNETQRRKK